MLAFVALMGLAGVQAALVERDFESAGDAQLTYDTETGLEWLDLPLTAGLSFNDMSLLLAPGQIYEGFRLATFEDVAALFENAGILTLTFGGFANTGESDEVLSLIELLGQTGFADGGFPGPAFRGLYDESFSPGTHAYASIGIREIDLFTLATIGQSIDPIQFSDDLSNSSIGTLLVRDAVVVPVPAALWLVLSGLGSLLAFGRKS